MHSGARFRTTVEPTPPSRRSISEQKLWEFRSKRPERGDSVPHGRASIGWMGGSTHRGRCPALPGSRLGTTAGGLPPRPAEEQRRQEGTWRKALPGGPLPSRPRAPAEARPPPGWLARSAGLYEAEPLTCKGLRRPGWRRMARVRDCETPGNPGTRDRRKAARAGGRRRKARPALS